MILALSRVKDNIGYSIINKSLNDLKHGIISPEESDKIDQFGLGSVAISEKSDDKVLKLAQQISDNLGIPVNEIDHKHTLLTANWLNLGNTNLKEVIFPHVAFVDCDDETLLYIVSSPTKSTLVANTKGKSLSENLVELQKLMKMNTLEKAAKLGDETSSLFTGDIDNIKESVLFEKLTNLFHTAFNDIKNLTKYDTGDKNVDDKLEEYALADFAASFQEALVKYLLIRIFETAGSTGISLITLSGEFAKNSRFREMAIRLAHNVKYDIRFPEDAHYENPSIAIAARAFLNKYGQMQF